MIRIIKIISSKTAMKIIDSQKPQGKFLIFENGRYVAIDNSSSGAWTKTFGDLKECLKYLRGDLILNI